MRTWLQIAGSIVVAVSMTGCYYLQAASGHLELMRKARPISDLLIDPDIDPQLRAQLVRSQEIRAFALTELGLPDNGSYTYYADLQREAVVWNVVAVPELDLTPRQWCFPIAGCLTYRGYFSERRARAMATRLSAEGYDTQVGRVAAYSTLGRFKDPLLSTMVARGETPLASVIFHELAHQRVYISGDTAFNEAYATAVEEYGTRRWLAAQGDEKGLRAYEQLLERRRLLDGLIDRQRARLAELYTSPLEPAVMRDAKSMAFQQMRIEYATTRSEWTDGPNFDGFLSRPLNNANLTAVSTYRALVPAFHRLLEQAGDIETFHRRAAELGARPRAQRHALLRKLLEDEEAQRYAGDGAPAGA
jgi:predicted aminopeptidase